MKKGSKIIKILIITLVCITNFGGIININKIKAATIAETIEPYSKGEVVLFNYDGIGIGVEIQVYEKEGIEYPVYCLDKGKRGVEIDFSYAVDISEMLSNQKIWRAITNGYPFKTPEELGCNSMEEAYAATKMAVYDAMYNYDLSKFSIHTNSDSNKRTVKAINKIITAARNSKETKTVATLDIKPDSSIWEVDPIDSNYISKTYSINAPTVTKNYKISLKNDNYVRIKVTDVYNKERTEFTQKEKFKILIPIADIDKAGEFTITATTELKTLPIFYGKSPNKEWQNYAVTVGEYEIAGTSLKQSYQENKTKIEIKKQDGETKLPLKNAKFNLLDENKQILYSELITDDEGIIELQHLLPGIYYLEEIKAPEGYYGYDELIMLEIKLNQKTVIVVENYEKQDEKPNETPQEENEILVGNKKLPKTGF